MPEIIKIASYICLFFFKPYNLKKCFLIDDDLDDQEIFLIAINSLDLQIECIMEFDCVVAMEKLKDDISYVPDYIFLDINMPKMSGLQCLGEIRKLSHLDHSKVVIYSTTLSDSIKSKAIALGANDLVVKQHTISKLSETLATVFL